MAEIATDVAVVGAGSGGLSVAAGAAQLGLKVVLFERGRMGGECLNTGCVPSKALIAAAAAAHAPRQAARLGVSLRGDADFAAVMAHVRQVIAAIEPHDSQARFEGLGVQVVRQSARFVGPRTLEAGALRVRARRIVLATGSRPRIPEIPGLEDTPYLTNETIFNLTARPERLLIIGGGSVGLELGQAFHRLGSEVTIVEATEPLAREDRDLVEPLLWQLAQEGVRLLRRAQIVGAGTTPTALRLRILKGGRTEDLEGSHLLVATGRAPNVEDLDPAVGRVRVDGRGIVIDRSLRSISNRAVFAVGDIAGREALTHAASAQASLVVRRLAFALRGRADRLLIPRVTYTDPEVASIGLSEAEAIERYGPAVRTVSALFAGNDRAIAEADPRGRARLVLGPRGRLLGASIVGPQAGDLIQVWGLAMQAGVPLRKLAALTAPYPTRGEISRRVAAEVFAPLLFSPGARALARLLKRWA